MSLHESLMEAIVSDQVADLIDEVRMEGPVHILYAIDPNDLITYCFPYGIESERINENNASFSYIADEHISLYTLFNNSSTRLLVLDEYQKELEDFRDHVVGYSKEKRKLVDTISDVETTYIKKMVSFEEWRNRQRVMREILPFMVSYAIGLHARGLDLLYKLGQNGKLIFSVEDFKESEIPEMVLQVFPTSRPGKLTSILFESVSEKISAIHTDKGPLDSDELDRELARKYRDCKVIDRLIKINIELEELYLKKKIDSRYIVLFISSAKRVEELFQDPAFHKYMPIIAGNRFNFHRKSAQVFINLITKTENREEALRSLEILHSYFTMAEKFKETKQVARDIYKSYRNKIRDLRETFEQYGLLAQFESFEDIIRSAKNGDIKELNPVVSKLIEHLKSGKQKEKTELREESLVRMVLAQHFLSAHEVQARLKAGKGFLYNYGKDHIKGVAHHLPLLFHTTSNHVNAAIWLIAESYLDSVMNEQAKAENLLREIENHVQFLFEKSEKALSSEDWLVMLFLFLLFPRENEEQDIAAKLVLREASIIMNHFGKRDNNIKGEYYYLASFAARRLNEFEESIQIIEEGLKFDGYLSKARLYHSKCLTQYSEFMYQEENSLKKSFHLLEDAVKSGETAISAYENKSQIKVPLGLLKKQKSALYNTLAYINTTLFAHKKDVKYDDAADIYLEKLKNQEGRDFGKYPEYLDTEATIYLNKYRYGRTRDVQLLNKAKMLMEQALNTNHGAVDPDYNKRLSEIIELLRISAELNQENKS